MTERYSDQKKDRILQNPLFDKIQNYLEEASISILRYVSASKCTVRQIFCLPGCYDDNSGIVHFP